MPSHPETTLTPIASGEVGRRTLLRAATWSVPVVAVSLGVPYAAASVVAPATFWGTGATVSVVSGNVTNYTLEGTDAGGNFAALPQGSTVLITPGPGVTLALIDATGITAILNPDGTILATITATDSTQVRIRFRPTGPSGSTYQITTNVNIDPFTETIPVTIR